MPAFRRHLLTKHGLRLVTVRQDNEVVEQILPVPAPELQRRRALLSCRQGGRTALRRRLRASMGGTPYTVPVSVPVLPPPLLFQNTPPLSENHTPDAGGRCPKSTSSYEPRAYQGSESGSVSPLFGSDISWDNFPDLTGVKQVEMVDKEIQAVPVTASAECAANHRQTTAATTVSSSKRVYPRSYQASLRRHGTASRVATRLHRRPCLVVIGQTRFSAWTTCSSPSCRVWL